MLAVREKRLFPQLLNTVLSFAIRFLRREGKKFRAGHVSNVAHTAEKKLTLQSVE